MGNFPSACNSILSPKTNSKTARVIFPTGEIRQFQTPIKAAEIMIDCPNFFLINSQSLTINRRFSPLSADEELESGNVYVMFPMRRLGSKIAAADMAVFWVAGKGIAGNVSRESEKDGDEGKVALLETVVEVPEFSRRVVICRSRRPLLDTIAEETGVCR